MHDVYVSSGQRRTRQAKIDDLVCSEDLDTLNTFAADLQLWREALQKLMRAAHVNLK